jgi:hypothetical protein
VAKGLVDEKCTYAVKYHPDVKFFITGTTSNLIKILLPETQLKWAPRDD